MTDFSCLAISHPGKVRDHNEDLFSCDDENGLWIVLDGMGGHDAGEVASEVACESILASINNGKSLEQAIADAHIAILDASAQGIGMPGMGTTVVALQITDSNYKVAWVGDSRGYLWEAGHLLPLTRDHSFVQELLDSGEITAEEAFNHPRKNLIDQALGIPDLEQVQVDSMSGKCKKDQLFLLCSDGLTDELTEAEISAVFKQKKSLQDSVDKLLEATLSKGAKDNVTAVLVARDGADQQQVQNKIFYIIGIVLLISIAAFLIDFISR